MKRIIPARVLRAYKAKGIYAANLWKGMNEDGPCVCGLAAVFCTSKELEEKDWGTIAHLALTRATARGYSASYTNGFIAGFDDIRDKADYGTTEFGIGFEDGKCSYRLITRGGFVRESYTT